ncbi:hypothetical protein EHS25_007279 [Saitozyma podzolica]|uniref:PLOD1-3-like GT domain-containing protein n=1 Tax=Saitozyma podzolica TaxID=1890683 RepID=A0A427XN55_9TREE|nr:hypothetical protein EHS25_007279 [Saitozyma podzolica]
MQHRVSSENPAPNLEDPRPQPFHGGSKKTDSDGLGLGLELEPKIAEQREMAELEKWGGDVEDEREMSATPYPYRRGTPGALFASALLMFRGRLVRSLPRTGGQVPQALSRRLARIFLGVVVVIAAVTWYVAYGRGHRFSSLSSSKWSGEPIPRLHLFMPINKGLANQRFCRSVLTAVVHEYDPVIYNWEEDGDSGTLQKAKVSGLRNVLDTYLSEGTPDDLVLLTDATDVWFQLSPQFLVSRFQELDADIVVGADMKCWPNDEDSEDCTGVAESPLPLGIFSDSDDESGSGFRRPRWANSGTVIGRLSAMRPIFQKMTEMMESPEYDKWGTDQAAFNIFLAQGKIVVDPRFRLFWANSFDVPSMMWINTPYPPDGASDTITPWQLYPPLAHHKLTGEIPVVVHLNDHANKAKLEEWWGTPWFGNPGRRFKHYVHGRAYNATLRFVEVDGAVREERLKDLCESHLDIW